MMCELNHEIRPDINEILNYFRQNIELNNQNNCKLTI